MANFAEFTFANDTQTKIFRIYLCGWVTFKNSDAKSTLTFLNSLHSIFRFSFFHKSQLTNTNCHILKIQKIVLCFFSQKLLQMAVIVKTAAFYRIYFYKFLQINSKKNMGAKCFQQDGNSSVTTILSYRKQTIDFICKSVAQLP